jgi:hypothetical protein
MPSLPKKVSQFMERYGVESDELWCVHGKTWVILHRALERVATEQGISFDRPSVVACDIQAKSMIVCTFGKLGDRTEWSFGEASPDNSKNAYFAAMAEKRSRDRVILKLLAAHGTLYSEEEADDFKRQNPHVNKASDFYEEISNDIPESRETKMKVKDARPEYKVLLDEMRRIHDVNELREWGEAKASTINSLPGEWPTMFRGEYTKHKQSITDTRMAG